MTPETRPDDGEATALERARECLSGARERLADAERALGEVQAEGVAREEQPAPPTVEPSWRERLWRAPSEARIGLPELTEAFGVSESWVYARTRESADPRLPHAKLAGSLVFRVGEIRAWLRDHEQVVEAYRSEPAPGDLRVEDRRTA